MSEDNELSSSSMSELCKALSIAGYDVLQPIANGYIILDGAPFDLKYLRSGVFTFNVKTIIGTPKVYAVSRLGGHSGSHNVVGIIEWLDSMKVSVNDEPIGKKFDSNKPRWSLLPEGVLTQVVKVLTFGSTKYADNNWKQVEPFRDRYYNAMMRHIEAWWSGEQDDTETKIHHLAHAICCAMFLIWGDNHDK